MKERLREVTVCRQGAKVDTFATLRETSLRSISPQAPQHLEASMRTEPSPALTILGATDLFVAPIER